MANFLLNPKSTSNYNYISSRPGQRGYIGREFICGTDFDLIFLNKILEPITSLFFFYLKSVILPYSHYLISIQLFSSLCCNLKSYLTTYSCQNVLVETADMHRYKKNNPKCTPSPKKIESAKVFKKDVNEKVRYVKLSMMIQGP